jgi:hypothetical protein
MARGPSLVTIGKAQHRFVCHVCQGRLFSGREVKLNSGYIHLFVNDSLSLWDPDGGYP